MSLEISDLSWKREIEKGTLSNIHDHYGTLVLTQPNNIVIAGHNTPSVFQSLHKVKVGMLIKLNNKMESHLYQVKRVVIADPTEVQYLEETDDSILTLITCTEKDQKRLIIIAQEIS